MFEKYLCFEPSGVVRWISLDRRARHDSIYCGAEGIVLKDLYPIINCSCVEMVQSRLPGIVFFVDESGKVKDPMQPFNPLASEFYAGSRFGDFIHGPAVFFSLRRSEPLMEYDLFPLSPAEESEIEFVLGAPLPEKDPYVYGVPLDLYNSLSEDEQIQIQDNYEYNLQHPDQADWFVDWEVAECLEVVVVP